MLNKVREGKRAGKSADQLASEIDLRPRGVIASDVDANAKSIRAMYNHLNAM